MVVAPILTLTHICAFTTVSDPIFGDFHLHSVIFIQNLGILQNTDLAANIQWIQLHCKITLWHNGIIAIYTICLTVHSPIESIK